MATSTAAAAPVASQIEPNTSTSGISTSVSIPWVAIRSSGRPTETGSDLVHANTSPTAPASSIRRAASVAGSYLSVKTIRISVGIHQYRNGTDTTIATSETRL